MMFPARMSGGRACAEAAGAGQVRRVLIGHSMGAVCAVAEAIKHPEASPVSNAEERLRSGQATCALSIPWHPCGVMLSVCVAHQVAALELADRGTCIHYGCWCGFSQLILENDENKHEQLLQSVVLIDWT